MLLSEIKLDAVDYFEVSQVDRADEKFWQVIVWAEAPAPLKLTALHTDIDNCPKEIKKYLKHVHSIERTEDDSRELDLEDNVITAEDEGLMLMYPSAEFDADDALRNAKMIMSTYDKFGKTYQAADKE